MYTIKTRKLGFIVGCSVYGLRDWVIDLYKDGELVSVIIGYEGAGNGVDLRNLSKPQKVIEIINKQKA